MPPPFKPSALSGAQPARPSDCGTASDDRLAALAADHEQLARALKRVTAQLQQETSARQLAEAALRAADERYHAMTASAPDAIIAIDANQHILHFNRAAEAMFGYREQEAVGLHVNALLPARFRAGQSARYARFQQSAHNRYFGRILPILGLSKSGREFRADLALSGATINGRQVFTAILRDSSERRTIEERLLLAARVFDSTHESITMTDAQARIVAVNPAFEQITGYREQEVLGKNPNLLRSGRHDRAFYAAIWDSVRQHGQWRGDIWNRRKNGQVYPERMSISAVRDRRGRITAYVSVSSDISALTEAVSQLDFLSHHDPLTLLPNRALLADRMQQALSAARHAEHRVALLLFNVDRLQRVNDSLGHEAGDALLREVAHRAGQLAGPFDTLAHLGSDEFVLLVAQCSSNDDIIGQARRLADCIAQPMQIAGRDLVVTTSIGISVFPQDGNDAAELLKAADSALRHVKEHGRNSLHFFTGEMNTHAVRWLSIDSHLRRALERDELLLHYQPQVSLLSGRICGVEALVRWNNAQLGMVSPADFIALAEDTGLILPIGDWVMRQACRQNKAWQDAGLPPVRVAVNVSAHQFMAGAVPALVQSALAESGLHPRYLEVELTESVMMRDTEATQHQLAQLTAMGVSVSLDDFGTGYSSLGYLSRFALDKLKIDQTFVRNITSEPRSAAIAQATIALAHGLTLSVVAEGVETEGQLAFLRAIGCDAIQGYLFSRPLAASQLAELLAEPRCLAPALAGALNVADEARHLYYASRGAPLS